VLDRLLHRRQQLLQGDRLFEKIEGAEAGGLDCHVDRSVPGHHHHRHVEMTGDMPLLEQRDAIGVGHPDIEQDEVRTQLAAYPARRRGVLGHPDIVALVDQNLRKQFADADFVVNDQDD